MKERQTVFFTLPDKKLQIVITKLNLVLKSLVGERKRSVNVVCCCSRTVFTLSFFSFCHIVELVFLDEYTTESLWVNIKPITARKMKAFFETIFHLKLIVSVH